MKFYYTQTRRRQRRRKNIEQTKKCMQNLKQNTERRSTVFGWSCGPPPPPNIQFPRRYKCDFDIRIQREEEKKRHNTENFHEQHFILHCGLCVCVWTRVIFLMR